MKKYKDLSITIKVPVMMGIGSFAVLAAVCLLLMIPLRSNSLKDASEIARLHAEHTKERIFEHISGRADVARAYSKVIAQVAASEIIPKERKREVLMMEMQTLFDSEVGIKSMWCILEPDALDGMDEQYIHRVGSNSQGVFAPWFIGNQVTPIEIMNSADLYEVPRETGLETVGPTWQDIGGERIQLVSISVPVMLNNTFLGVIAIDFITAEMSNLIKSTYSNMLGKIITDEGIVAEHYDKKRIGRKVEYSNREILEKLADGNSFEGIFSYEGQLQYKVYVPIRLSEVNKPWFFAVDMPVAAIYSKANTTVFYLVVYFLLGIVLISFTVWVLIRPMLKQIKGVTDIIRKLSQGLIHLKIADRKCQDEIGVMETELNTLVKSLENAATFAQGIGEGNFNAEYFLMSKGDVLGNALLEMRQKLQVADRLKSSFLANMSHEIRTPLNGIVGLFNIICEDTILSDELKEFAIIINNNTKQLLCLINDILDASKIEAGEIEIRTQQFCINSMMNEIYVLFKHELKTHDKSHIHLECIKDERLKCIANPKNNIMDDDRKCIANGIIGNCTISTDPVRLRQIISNLLTNAVKFTQEGRICFGYKLMDTDKLEFFVEDTGIGIHESNLKDIFKRFRQVDSSNKRKYGGVGLGLSISLSLARMMGGDITVTSTEGKGSKFVFTMKHEPFCEAETMK